MAGYYLGNCAMRHELAVQVQNVLQSTCNIRNLGPIDILRVEFKAILESDTCAVREYGANSLLVAVPHDVIGNRSIDGVTGNQITDRAVAVAVSVLGSDGHVFRKDEHPMLCEGRVHSFRFPDGTDDFVEWINRFVNYTNMGDDDWVFVQMPI